MTDYKLPEHTKYDLARNLFTIGNWSPDGDHPEAGHVIIGMGDKSQLLHPKEAWDIGLHILERALQAWGYDWSAAIKFTQPLRSTLATDGKGSYWSYYPWFVNPLMEFEDGES